MKKLLVIALFFSVILIGCKKNDPPVSPPIVTTIEVYSITQTTANGGGNITSDGNAAVTSHGVCWSTSQNPTTSDNKTADGAGVGSFTSNITGLTANTTYYLRAYATNRAGTSYSDQVQFTTSPIITSPTVTTGTISSITQATANGGGNVTSDGNATVLSRGVCWSTSQNPTINNNKTNDGTGAGIFTSNITGLTANTSYYVRAYATNSEGTGYGDQVQFTTGQIITLPTVTTGTIANITQTTANGGGSVTSDGNSTATSRGVCWSTSQYPTINNNKTTDGTGAGGFTSNITGLTANTSYYVRAYATNSAGTSYGDQVQFTTGQAVTSPTVTTGTIVSVTQTTASGGGNVTSEGNSPVTSRGVCWSTSQNPTTNDNKTTDGAGVGSFTSNITGLTLNTTYYVRAWAKNSVNTAYGNQVSFATTTPTSPTVTTIAITNITQTTASSGGNVTSEGNAPVTSRGVCWSTSQNPTINDNKTTDGAGIGYITSNITGLTSNTTYYVRAWATNSVNTAYGNQVSFTTAPGDGPGTVTDIDGNVYHTVTIGTQVWMLENLKTTKYRNGDPIPNVTVNTAWGALTTGAYCWYNNDANTYKAAYGALYNWYAVSDSRNIAPIGWHVASDAEWTTLITYLGGSNVAGGKLKEAGTTHWKMPNYGATNETGFTALPGGSRGYQGGFTLIGENGSWWTSNAYDPRQAWTSYLMYGNDVAWRSYAQMAGGYSVRCVRD